MKNSTIRIAIVHSLLLSLPGYHFKGLSRVPTYDFWILLVNNNGFSIINQVAKSIVVQWLFSYFCPVRQWFLQTSNFRLLQLVNIVKVNLIIRGQVWLCQAAARNLIAGTQKVNDEKLIQNLRLNSFKIDWTRILVVLDWT